MDNSGISGENRSTPRVTSPRVTSTITNPTRTGLWLNSGLRDVFKRATDRLRHYTSNGLAWMHHIFVHWPKNAIVITRSYLWWQLNIPNIYILHSVTAVWSTAAYTRKLTYCWFHSMRDKCGTGSYSVLKRIFSEDDIWWTVKLWRMGRLSVLSIKEFPLTQAHHRAHLLNAYSKKCNVQTKKCAPQSDCTNGLIGPALSKFLSSSNAVHSCMNTPQPFNGW
jgi:hypothetical protein